MRTAFLRVGSLRDASLRYDFLRDAFLRVTLERYQQELGKDFKRITLYIRTKSGYHWMGFWSQNFLTWEPQRELWRIRL